MQVGKQDAEPNHANLKLIAVQQLTNKTLRFQENWFREFGVNGILCLFSVLKRLGMKNQIWPRMQIQHLSKLVSETGKRQLKKCVESFVFWSVWTNI